MKKSALALYTLLLAAIVMLPAAAHADTINLILTSPVQTGIPGSILGFEATVSAPLANTSTINLNGDSFNPDAPGSGLVMDDTPFLLNFPFFLNPGDSFTGELFTVSLPGGLIPGSYTGFFTIQGGPGGEQDPLATVTYQINVPGQSPVPEPGTWVLLVTGTGLMGAFVYSRRGNLASKIAA